jgi:hypothetical protein
MEIQIYDKYFRVIYQRNEVLDIDRKTGILTAQSPTGILLSSIPVLGIFGTVVLTASNRRRRFLAICTEADRVGSSPIIYKCTKCILVAYKLTGVIVSGTGSYSIDKRSQGENGGVPPLSPNEMEIERRKTSIEKLVIIGFVSTCKRK